MPANADAYRRAMRRWASGVTVVTTQHGGEARAILVTSFLSVAIDPPTVLVSIRRDGETHRLLDTAGVFAVNLLHQGQAALARGLGYANDPELRALRAVPHHPVATGAPVLDDCLAYLDCRVMDRHEAKDHTLFIGLVEACGTGNAPPLLHWERDFRRLWLEGDGRLGDEGMRG